MATVGYGVSRPIVDRQRLCCAPVVTSVDTLKPSILRQLNFTIKIHSMLALLGSHFQ